MSEYDECAVFFLLANRIMLRKKKLILEALKITHRSQWVVLQSFVRRPHEPPYVPPSVHPEVSVLLSRCLDLQQQNLRPRLGHRLQPPLWDQVSEKQKQVPQRSRPEHLSRSHPPPWVRDGPPLAAVDSPATSGSPLSVRFCCGPSRGRQGL